MGVSLIFKLFYHETMRLSHGGGGGKELLLLTSNYFVSWISFNLSFQRFLEFFLMKSPRDHEIVSWWGNFCFVFSLQII